MTKSKKTLFFSILSLVLLNISWTPRVMAGQVFYDFTATINQVVRGPVLNDSAIEGSTFTGVITFDPQQASVINDQNVKRHLWTSSNNGITVNVGGTTLSTHSSFNPLAVIMFNFGNTNDAVSIFGATGDLSGISLLLHGPLGACLENWELSSFPTNVSCFTYANQISIDGENYSNEGNYYVSGRIDSIVLRTPTSMINNLVNAVGQLNLRAGIANSLDSKLQNALDALNDARGGNNASAINKLNAFINSVNAQRGNGLTNQEADYLINLANQIIAAISAQ
jgi:hypothetical protein